MNGMTWTYLTCTICLAVFFLSCSEDEDSDPALSWQSEDISAAQEISGCGGFGARAEKLRADDEDTVEETPDEDGEDTTADELLDEMCGDERLAWTYDATAKTLTLTNLDISLNCCGEHAVGVVRDGDGLVLKEVDRPVQGDARCSCMCLFDFKAVVKDLDAATFPVTIRRFVTDSNQNEYTVWQGRLDLSQGEGEELIEENVGWCDL